MPKRFVRAVAFVVAACAIAWAVSWTWRFLRIDSCLDAGGRWNQETARCEH